jgi:hypothetical protein
VCIHMCVSVYVCMCVCVCVSMHVTAAKHTQNFSSELTVCCYSLCTHTSFTFIISINVGHLCALFPVHGDSMSNKAEIPVIKLFILGGGMEVMQIESRTSGLPGKCSTP